MIVRSEGVVVTALSLPVHYSMKCQSQIPLSLQLYQIFFKTFKCLDWALHRL
jgi:hypothetical protein